eukprot:1744835-Prymnesium_polylepis.1
MMVAGVRPRASQTERSRTGACSGAVADVEGDSPGGRAARGAPSGLSAGVKLCVCVGVAVSWASCVSGTECETGAGLFCA